MLRNCFLDFAVDHWFGCRATEPGFAGDIGAIELWLIDWVSVCLCDRSQEIDKGQATSRSKEPDDDDDDDDDVPPPIAGSLWKPGSCFPDLKACMHEKQFHIKIVKEKKKVSEFCC